MDYVVKPVEYYPFAMRLKRAVRVIRELSGRSILLPFADEARRVPIKDILYVEVHSHTVEYYTYFGKSVMTSTLKQVERQLPEKCFVRCNSCYLVNLRHVTGIKDDSVVIEGTMLKISRSKKREFMERLSAFYSEGNI
jgi:DNA-binding LytR/AlgR family response regulator